jgi:ParB-like chromosome segregation protein Spo0J
MEDIKLKNVELKSLGKLDLYEVPLGLICFADDPTKPFYNPRYSVSGAIDGLDALHMEELYEGIRSEGLQNFPTVRVLADGTLQLIRGERRVRNLLRLVNESKSVMCWDLQAGKWGRPAQVYKHVICHVLVDCDDNRAHQIAFSDNDQAVGFSEACTAAFVRILNERGRTDEEIMLITGKQISWLRDTYTINELDPKCRLAFESGEVNRTIALELTAIENEAERHACLAEIKAHAILRHQEKIITAQAQSSYADAKLELALTNLATNDGTPEDVEAARLHHLKKTQELEKLQAQKPKGTTKDLQAIGATSKHSLSASKLEKAWLVVINKMLDSQDFSEYSEETLQLSKHLVEAMLNGRADIREVLSDFVTV